MDTQTTPAFNWLRKIPGDLYSLDEKPLLGFPPPFPWDKYSEEINKSLQTSGISVTANDIQWRALPDLFTGLGENLKGLLLAVAPIQGPVWWVMPEKAIEKLVDLFIPTQNNNVTEKIVDEEFQKAFLQFIAAEAINAFEKVDFDKKLSTSVTNTANLPTEPCLGIDISIKIKEEAIYGRLLLSSAFKKSWAQRYVQKQQKLALESPTADSLDVIIHLEAGKIDLLPSEWRELRIGDFVLLDKCSLDPDEDKGRVMLVINGTPCFRAKIKQGSLKILEHPLYHEVDTSMPTPPSKNDQNAPKEEGEFDEEDIEEENNQDVAAEEEEEFEIEDDENDIEKTANIPPPKAARPTEPPKKTAASTETAPADAELNSGKPLQLEDIPLPVVIEVGRIQMTVKKLLELQPGNMLELDIHPEAGVDMVVNGKRIARGELLRIGDAFGMRITELS